MKTIALLSTALLLLLSACADDKPMDEAQRQKMIKDMQASEVYH